MTLPTLPLPKTLPLLATLVGTHIAFYFCKNPFYIELGLGIVVVGALHPFGGINNSNLMLSLVEGF
jgi:hypothetical protein